MLFRSADWSVIRDLKESLGVPVIANGDIFGVEDADRVVAETGCDAVMVGRAALGYPWIFRELAASWKGAADIGSVEGNERVQIILRHLGEHLEHVGDEDRGIKKFRTHLTWYSRGLRGGGAFRERAMHLTERAAVEDAVSEFFEPVQMQDRTERAVYDERTAFG